MINPDYSDSADCTPKTEPDAEAERLEYLAETHVESFQYGVGRTASSQYLMHDE